LIDLCIYIHKYIIILIIIYIILLTGPAIGQALGPLGLNMADFCKQFNEKTKLYEKDIPVPVVLEGEYLY